MGKTETAAGRIRFLLQSIYENQETRTDCILGKYKACVDLDNRVITAAEFERLAGVCPVEGIDRRELATRLLVDLYHFDLDEGFGGHDLQAAAADLPLEQAWSLLTILSALRDCWDCNWDFDELLNSAYERSRPDRNDTGD